MGAAVSPTCLGASRLGSGFVEPIGENGLGLGRGPAVGQHLIEPRIARMQAEKKVTDIAPWLDPVTLRAGQDRAQHRRPAAYGQVRPSQGQTWRPAMLTSGSCGKGFALAGLLVQNARPARRGRDICGVQGARPPAQPPAPGAPAGRRCPNGQNARRMAGATQAVPCPPRSRFLNPVNYRPTMPDYRVFPQKQAPFRNGLQKPSRSL